MIKLVEKFINKSSAKYSWSISLSNLEHETFKTVEDSQDSDNSSKPTFQSPDEAYKDGLKALKKYDDKIYMLEVYDNTGNYSNYMAVNNKGKITEY